jgi:glyoxylase-like metal-dependent hydrolase (beta-lactamase superfamily II)
VYSHFHADHVGGSRRLFELLAAAPPRVIASEHTAVWMSRFRSDLPRPTDVLDWPSGTARFEDVTVRLAGLPCPCHAPDHAMFLLEEERVGHTADLVNIDQLPFGGFGGQEPLVLLAPNLEFVRSLEFDWFCGGHGNIGEKSDIDFYLNYMGEVAALVDEYVPRPTEAPDLSLTDYLAAGLDPETKSRLLSELNNHFGLYLYGSQIVAGLKPSWDGGDPFMTGHIAEWAAARQRAADQAVPKSIPPRPSRTYGRPWTAICDAAGRTAGSSAQKAAAQSSAGSAVVPRPPARQLDRCRSVARATGRGRQAARPAASGVQLALLRYVPMCRLCGKGCLRPTLPLTYSGSRSSVGLSSRAHQASTSKPPQSPARTGWPSSGIPRAADRGCQAAHGGLKAPIWAMIAATSSAAHSSLILPSVTR